MARKLKSLFSRSEIIKVAGAHNALGAKLVERAGFDCVWSSGFEISASFGVPDASIITMTEYLSIAQSMVHSVKIPIIVDADTGFGNHINVSFAVRKLESAGVSALCIEDKEFPKVNSFIDCKQCLTDIPSFVRKIDAAKSIRRSSEFMIIARTEAFNLGFSLNETLERATAYAESGADAILIHNKTKSVHFIKEFLEKWSKNVPIIVIPTTFSSVTCKELEQMGVKMVIYANHGIRAAIKAMEEIFKKILADGTTANIENQIASLDLVFELQDMPKYINYKNRNSHKKIDIM